MTLKISATEYSQRLSHLQRAIAANGYELLTHYPTEMDALIVKNWKPMERLKGWLLWRSR